MVRQSTCLTEGAGVSITLKRFLRPRDSCESMYSNMLRSPCGNSCGCRILVGIAAMICDREFTDELTASLRHLRAFGSGLCPNASRIDDLVQQTALQAWAARHQFRAEGSLKSWLFTILRNCYFRELHGRRCEVEDPNGAIADSVAMPAEHDGHC